MNRPKIICHILQSVDGNIGGSFFSQPETMPALQEFARIREEYACDAIISGAATAVEIYANNTADVLPEVNETYPRNDWQAEKVDKYAFAFMCSFIKVYHRKRDCLTKAVPFSINHCIGTFF